MTSPVGSTGDQPGLQPGPGLVGEPVAAPAQHAGGCRRAGRGRGRGARWCRCWTRRRTSSTQVRPKLARRGTGRAPGPRRAAEWPGRWRSRGTGRATRSPPAACHVGLALGQPARPAPCRSGPRPRRATAPAGPGSGRRCRWRTSVGCAPGGAQERGLVTPTARTALDRTAEGGSSRAGSSINGVPRSMTWSITVHQATPSCAASPRDRGVTARRPARRPTPGPARSGTPAARSPHAARSRSRTSHNGCGQHQTRLTPAEHHRPPPDRQVTHPDRAAVLRPRHRPAARATDQVRGGLHQQLQLAAGIRGREHDEPVQPEQRSYRAAVSDAVASLIAWGPSRSWPLGRDHGQLSKEEVEKSLGTLAEGGIQEAGGVPATLHEDALGVAERSEALDPVVFAHPARADAAEG